jgi:hypothetical protein
MKRIIAFALVAGFPALAFAQDWKNANFIDAGCVGKMKDKTDAHTRECALKCSDTGYGIVVGGKFLKFDDAGNKQTLAELKKSTKKDHLRVDVSGALTGDTIAVKTVKID